MVSTYPGRPLAVGWESCSPNIRQVFDSRRVRTLLEMPYSGYTIPAWTISHSEAPNDVAGHRFGFVLHFVPGPKPRTNFRPARVFVPQESIAGREPRRPEHEPG